tara:strand:- start:675 stop:1097 length:423 start_codon:yes stop_codon:yes gene_type:complete
MTKKLLFEKEDRVAWLLENGLVQTIYRTNEVSKGFTIKYAPYWHPYELRHLMRDYAAYSPLSYVRLGQKIKSLGLCIEGDDDSWNLKKLLTAIAKHISMNAKPWKGDDDHQTVKQKYGSREGFRKGLLHGYKRYLTKEVA